MSAVTIGNLPNETHRALKARASRNGRSTEAEIRAILDDAVRPQMGIGFALAALGRRFGPIPDIQRDRTPVEPAEFE